jgi:hypothetical protein
MTHEQNKKMLHDEIAEARVRCEGAPLNIFAQRTVDEKDDLLSWQVHMLPEQPEWHMQDIGEYGQAERDMSVDELAEFILSKWSDDLDEVLTEGRFLHPRGHAVTIEERELDALCIEIGRAYNFLSILECA